MGLSDTVGELLLSAEVMSSYAPESLGKDAVADDSRQPLTSGLGPPSGKERGVRV
jgi:hypothetical protein